MRLCRNPPLRKGLALLLALSTIAQPILAAPGQSIESVAQGAPVRTYALQQSAPALNQRLTSFSAAYPGLGARISLSPDLASSKIAPLSPSPAALAAEKVLAQAFASPEAVLGMPSRQSAGMEGGARGTESLAAERVEYAGDNKERGVVSPAASMVRGLGRMAKPWSAGLAAAFQGSTEFFDRARRFSPEADVLGGAFGAIVSAASQDGPRQGSDSAARLEPRAPSFWADLRGKLAKTFQKQEPPKLSEHAAKVMVPFARGQYWGTIKAASLNPFFSVAMKMLGGYDAVKSAWSGYTGASGLTVPFAPIIANYFYLHRVLSATVAVRMLIWSALIPVLALTLSPGLASLPSALIGYAAAPFAVAATALVSWWAVKQLQLSSRAALRFSLLMSAGVSLIPVLVSAFGWLPWFQGLLFALMMVDGFVYSFHQAYDLDTGGGQQIAKEQGFFEEINTSKALNYFDAKYENVYFAASALFPLLIGLVPIIAGYFTGAPIGSLILGMMALTFAFSGGMEIYHYSKIPTPKDKKPAMDVKDYARHFWDGIKTIVGDRRLLSITAFGSFTNSGWRSIVRMFALSYFGLMVLGPALGLSEAWGTYLGVALVSLASAAGSAAGWLVGNYWRAPALGELREPRYRIFFNLNLLSGLVTAAFPLSALLIASGHLAAGVALVTIGAFLFNLIFQIGRQGMRNLKKKIAGDHGDVARVFGITESLDMLTQGAVGVAFAALLQAFGGQALPVFQLLPVLWITFGFFMALGLMTQIGRWLHFHPGERERKPYVQQLQGFLKGTQEEAAQVYEQGRALGGVFAQEAAARGLGASLSPDEVQIKFSDDVLYSQFIAPVLKGEQTGGFDRQALRAKLAQRMKETLYPDSPVEEIDLVLRLPAVQERLDRYQDLLEERVLRGPISGTR